LETFLRYVRRLQLSMTKYDLMTKKYLVFDFVWQTKSDSRVSLIKTAFETWASLYTWEEEIEYAKKRYKSEAEANLRPN